jgi:hypothetical protein
MQICCLGSLHLQHLFIRTVGQDLAENNRWFAKRDEDRYDELASFIDSVRLTLETLLFEQGLEPERAIFASCHGSRGHGPQKGRPMDSRFLDKVMPVLLRGPWPTLKSITILGVGGPVRQIVSCMNYVPEDPAVFEAAEDRLRVSLPPSVSLSWNAEFGKTFYFYSLLNYSYSTNVLG